MIAQSNVENKPKTSSNSSIIATIDWLKANGCVALPVAPAQAKPLGKDGKPLFNGKNPSYLDASGKAHLIKHTKYRESPPTADELATWFANSQNGIGTLAGGGGIDWIDLDLKNFGNQSDCDNARAMILEKCDRTYFETTRSGGAHIAVRLVESKDFTNFQVGDSGHAGEFLGHGRFVVLAPTAGYVSQNGSEIASVAKASDLHIHPVRRKAEHEPEKQTQETENFGHILDRHSDGAFVNLVDIISKTSKEVLKNPKSKDISADLAKLARELYACADWFPSVGLPLVGSPSKLLSDAAERLGCDAERLERIIKDIPQTGGKPGLLKYRGSAQAAKWYEKLLQKSDSSDGGEDACKELQKILDLRAYYTDRAKFNQLSQKIEIDGQTVDDIEGERIYYIQKTNKSIGTDFFCQIIRVIASENSYHPVALYLESVAEKSTDTSVLNGIAKRYFGTDDPLYDTYVKRWLISAVARIFEPGCKADCALFLQGGQGARKSTFFQRLAGADFFSDSLGDTQNNKDEILLMHRFWIHEYSELETVFRKKEMASVKSFLARGFDSVRPPYRRDLIDLKRACVFAGTTNEQAFLSDNTGDRRFWTIPVKGKINTGLLDTERDLIWAAAVALYQAGEQWHLTELEEASSRDLNAQFRSLDPWHDKIAATIENRDFITINEILTLGFSYEIKNIGRKEQLRVSGVLTALGWNSSTKKVGGRTVRGWVAPAEISILSRLKAVGDWGEYIEVSRNAPKEILDEAWANLSLEKKNQIVTWNPEPKPEPEPIEEDIFAVEEDIFAISVNVAADSSSSHQIKVGDKVLYFGSKYPSYQGLQLTVEIIKNNQATCIKPDGSKTTNLDLNHLSLTSEV